MHGEHSILVSSHGDYEKPILHYLDHSTCVYTQVRRWLRINGAEARLFWLVAFAVCMGNSFPSFLFPSPFFSPDFCLNSRLDSAWWLPQKKARPKALQ